MLIGRDSTGKAQEIRTNENGNLEVVVTDGSATSSETTLNASVQTVGTTATTINVNKKVTSIDIANYSESANVTVGVGTSNYVIGSSVATSLAINKDVTTISLTSTEADTKVQIVVKGIEESQEHSGDDSGDDEQTLIPITENMDFTKLVKPLNNIVLEKNILQYIDDFEDVDISSLIDGDELTKTFYGDVYFYDSGYENMFSVDSIGVTYKQQYDYDLDQYGDWEYSFDMYGYFTCPDDYYPDVEKNGLPFYSISYKSTDGINFTPNYKVAFNDTDDGFDFIPVDYIPFYLGIVGNFSELDGGTWNDVISEFLFTDNED